MVCKGGQGDSGDQFAHHLLLVHGTIRRQLHPRPGSVSGQPAAHRVVEIFTGTFDGYTSIRKQAGMDPGELSCPNGGLRSQHLPHLKMDAYLVRGRRGTTTSEMVGLASLSNRACSFSAQVGVKNQVIAVSKAARGRGWPNGTRFELWEDTRPISPILLIDSSLQGGYW